MTYTDRDRMTDAKSAFEAALADPAKWCASGRCHDTNWGGTDRLHYRSDTCPEFDDEELREYIVRAEARIARYDD